MRCLENVVQETYARWYAMSRQQQAEIASPAAWLTTVAGRICLDLLGSAKVRRESYVGEWIPEPLPDRAEWTPTDEPAPPTRPGRSPSTSRSPWKPLEAWRRGRTGSPFVDAGMRQLLAQGWTHNWVRMMTASFLAKDLHVRWTVSARRFLDHLLDGDLASNNHGWQWVAGTDAAPCVRVFNPVGQGPAPRPRRRLCPPLGA